MIFAFTITPMLEGLDDAPGDTVPPKLFLGVPDTGWHTSVRTLKNYLRKHGAVFLDNSALGDTAPADEVLLWQVAGHEQLFETHVHFVPGLKA